MSRPATLALCLGLFAAPAASATSFSFHCVSGDGGGACTIPLDQLSVEVADLGAGQVSFTFHNDGSDPSSIVAAYFDDDAGLLASVVSIQNSSGVDFSAGGPPPELPSGTVEDFDSEWVFRADNPAKSHGLNPGEVVTIVFSLAAGTSYADLIAAIGAGELRVGLFAPAFRDHGNKSFVTGGRVLIPAPEPGTLALLATALAGAVAAGRRS